MCAAGKTPASSRWRESFPLGWWNGTHSEREVAHSREVTDADKNVAWLKKSAGVVEGSDYSATYLEGQDLGWGLLVFVAPLLPKAALAGGRGQEHHSLFPPALCLNGPVVWWQFCCTVVQFEAGD